MTKAKEVDELTDEAAIRRIFPPELVKQAKGEALKAAERVEKREKRLKLKDSK